MPQGSWAQALHSQQVQQDAKCSPACEPQSASSFASTQQSWNNQAGLSAGPVDWQQNALYALDKPAYPPAHSPAAVKAGLPSQLGSSQGQAPIAAPLTASIAAPMAAPVPAPVPAPIAAPIAAPIYAPNNAPTAAPIEAPTAAPITAPIHAPTNAPIAAPTTAPTAAPIAAPIYAPTKDAEAKLTNCHQPGEVVTAVQHQAAHLGTAGPQARVTRSTAGSSPAAGPAQSPATRKQTVPVHQTGMTQQRNELAAALQTLSVSQASMSQSQHEHAAVIQGLAQTSHTDATALSGPWALRNLPRLSLGEAEPLLQMIDCLQAAGALAAPSSAVSHAVACEESVLPQADLVTVPDGRSAADCTQAQTLDHQHQVCRTSKRVLSGVVRSCITLKCARCLLYGARYTWVYQAFHADHAWLCFTSASVQQLGALMLLMTNAQAVQQCNTAGAKLCPTRFCNCCTDNSQAAAFWDQDWFAM